MLRHTCKSIELTTQVPAGEKLMFSVRLISKITKLYNFNTLY